MLIVEDHALLRRVIREFLQSAFPSCSFREATDGAGALEACRAYRPQLVLMELVRAEAPLFASPWAAISGDGPRERRDPGR